jgi:hypothetical protein
MSGTRKIILDSLRPILIYPPPAVVKENKRLCNRRRYVYFVISESGHIKIGIANNVKKRMIIMRTDNPYPIKLLGKIKAEGHPENEIHKMFSQYRVRGEWFMDVPEIRKFIEKYKMGKHKKKQ